MRRGVGFGQILQSMILSEPNMHGNSRRGEYAVHLKSADSDQQ
jgi:hypothetical protein